MEGSGEVLGRSPRRRQPTCTNHCVKCGAHFSSLGAFDAHREGPPDARRCRNPERVARLAAKSTHGRCDLAAPELRVNGVAVWSLLTDLEGAAAPWQGEGVAGASGVTADVVDGFYAGLAARAGGAA